MSISVGEFKSALSAFLNRAAFGRERVIVSSHGKPKAALISIEDLQLLEDLEDAQAAREALQAYRTGDTVPWEEVKPQLLREQE